MTYVNSLILLFINGINDSSVVVSTDDRSDIRVLVNAFHRFVKGLTLSSVEGSSRGIPHSLSECSPNLSPKTVNYAVDIHYLFSMPFTYPYATLWLSSHKKPTNSLAIAVVTTCDGFPFALSLRYLLHNLSCAFQLMFFTSWGRFSNRFLILALTRLGYLYDQADSTKKRLAWELPVLVIPPLKTVAPLDCSLGTRPT